MHGRQPFACRGAPGNGFVLDFGDGCAGAAVEHENFPALGRCDQCGTAPARRFPIGKNGWGGDVVVPDVVVDGLEAPADVARGNIQGDDGTRIPILFRGAVTAEEVGGGVSRGQENEPQVLIGTGDGPDVGRAAWIGLAGAERGMRGRVQQTPCPQQVSGVGIVAAHDARRFIARLIVENERSDDRDPPDNNRQRCHVVVTGQGGADAGLEVHRPAVAEIGARRAARGIDRQQSIIHRGGQQAPAAGAGATRGSMKSDTAAGQVRNAIEVGLRVVPPDFLAAVGIEGDDYVGGSAEVQPVFNADRRCLQCSRRRRGFAGGQAGYPIRPGGLQAGHVACVYLTRVGMARCARIASVVRPCAVSGAVFTGGEEVRGRGFGLETGCEMTRDKQARRDGEQRRVDAGRLEIRPRYAGDQETQAQRRQRQYAGQQGPGVEA